MTYENDRILILIVSQSMDKEQKKVKIQCHSYPAYGHAIPMVRIIEILQKKNPHYEIVYLTSKFFVEKIKDIYPHVKMFGIEDGVTAQQDHHGFHTYESKTLSHFVFLYHQEYFKNKQNHPDLMICDIFSRQALEYCNRHNITSLVNSIFGYSIIQDLFSFPRPKTSFGLGGFTVCYPMLFNPFQIIMGFTSLHDSFLHKNKFLINSAIGFDPATTVPTHHTFTGFLSNRSTKKVEIDKELQQWIDSWKKEGKKKFIYISFGTYVDPGEKFISDIQKAVEATGYPAIWSLRNDYGKINSKLIFMRKWQPQEAILALDEVCCVFTHGGWGSTTESIIAKTPIICVPCFGDQFESARLIHQNKIGIQLYKSAPVAGPPLAFNPPVTLQSIVIAISKVMEGDSFQKNIDRVSAICSAYRTDEIVNDAVANTLEFGNDYLIDHEFEKATKRSTVDTLKFVFLVVLLVVVWRCRTNIINLF